MVLAQDIEHWDGKSSSDFESTYYSYCDDATFTADLISLVKKESLQNGATWLIKQHFENQHSLDAKEIADIYTLLPTLVPWEAKLHILQCIPHMPIGVTEKRRVEIFLRQCLTDTNKFIRAWAYNGFYEISLQYPEYKIETQQFFEMAMRDEAPSVKARIRNILNKGF